MRTSVGHDRRIHPGAGRRRGSDYPKGRQVDPAALAQVQALLGERERRRDLLIEHLHLLQDHFGCLHARHLAALAEEMRLALVEVYEVASFYAHFDIVMDGEAPPPPLTVRVCDSLSCELAGAGPLLENLRGLIIGAEWFALRGGFLFHFRQLLRYQRTHQRGVDFAAVVEHALVTHHPLPDL